MGYMLLGGFGNGTKYAASLGRCAGLCSKLPYPKMGWPILGWALIRSGSGHTLVIDLVLKEHDYTLHHLVTSIALVV